MYLYIHIPSFSSMPKSYNFNQSHILLHTWSNTKIKRERSTFAKINIKYSSYMRYRLAPSVALFYTSSYMRYRLALPVSLFYTSCRMRYRIAPPMTLIYTSPCMRYRLAPPVSLIYTSPYMRYRLAPYTKLAMALY